MGEVLKPCISRGVLADQAGEAALGRAVVHAKAQDLLQLASSAPVRGLIMMHGGGSGVPSCCCQKRRELSTFMTLQAGGSSSRYMLGAVCASMVNGPTQRGERSFERGAGCVPSQVASDCPVRSARPVGGGQGEL